MCPRDKNFVEVDEKNLLGPRCNSPSFVSFSTEKNILIKTKIRKTSNLVWGLNLGIHARQKNFKPFRHRRSIHAS